MASVVSALKANNPIGPLRKNVNDLSLTFITPLSAYDHDA
jgi:hypothetical protein